MHSTCPASSRVSDKSYRRAHPQVRRALRMWSGDHKKHLAPPFLSVCVSPLAPTYHQNRRRRRRRQDRRRHSRARQPCHSSSSSLPPPPPPPLSLSSLLLLPLFSICDDASAWIRDVAPWQHVTTTACVPFASAAASSMPSTRCARLAASSALPGRVSTNQ